MLITISPDLYYTAFPDDKKVCQSLVYGIYALEIAQTIMITHDAFQNFVYGFGEMSALDDLQVLWFDTAIVDGIGECARLVDSPFFLNRLSTVAFMVQTYFAYRIYLLSRSKVIPCLALAVSSVLATRLFTSY